MNSPKDRASAPLYCYRFGNVTFDEARFELLVGGLPVDLEQKPLQLLSVLLQHGGEVVSHAALRAAVWQGRMTVEHVLSNAVGKLRRALGDDDGRCIESVPRKGYRFGAQFTRAVCGMRLCSRLDLVAGNPVPGREGFKLVRQLGATSGSEVWLAREDKNEVLTVFKFNQGGEHSSVLRREATVYRLLREALGERADLVRMIDWNLETPPFYLQCAYGGPDLLQWARNGNLTPLTRAERIELFLQTADAIAAAHSVGVLHKDLKPSNILVSERPGGGWHIRVADFGSARLLEPERLQEFGITQLGSAVTQSNILDPGAGTPLYLAPELILGQPPTAHSDIYALGLILYQLLIGDLRRPMASGWERDIADSFLEADIAAATAGDPARRLLSVIELTQRLRTLDGRRAAESAWRSERERLQRAERAMERWRARRPWALAAVATLILGLTTGLVLYGRERQARLQAERAVTQTQEIDRFLSDDLLGAADPAVPGGAHNPRMSDVLARAAATLQARFPTQPEIKAPIELAIGDAYAGLTDYPNAEKYRKAAWQLLSTSEGAASASALQAEYRWIEVLIQTNRLEQAQRMLDTADSLAGTRLDSDSRVAFEAHWARAGYYKLRQDVSRALTEYAAADRIRAVIEPDNDNLLVRARDSLSWCYVRLNRTEEGEHILSQVINARYTPERVGAIVWAQARIDDGIALMSLQRYDAAQEVLTEALQELRRSAGPDHFFVGYAENELGELYTRRHQWPAAVASLNEAHRIFAKLTGEDGQATLTAGANLGIVQYRTGAASQAVTILTQVSGEFSKMFGAKSPQVQIVDFYLASAQHDLHENEKAALLVAPLQPEALASAEPRQDWPPRLQALRGCILIGRGHKADGLALLRPAVQAMEQLHTPEDDLAPFRRVLDRP